MPEGLVCPVITTDDLSWHGEPLVEYFQRLCWVRLVMQSSDCLIIIVYH